MRVSEKIGDDFRHWKQGDTITITAGTGKGKSHFIKNKLFIHAKNNGKKILMLVHRLNCLNQFQYEIQKEGKTNVITLGTYQSIEQSSLNGVKSNIVNPADFDYVVCDEFHYFMSDASFNKTTDLSLKAILKATNSIRIFMSATGDYVERYLTNYKNISIESYQLPIKFEFIKTLDFYKKDETLELCIESAIKNNKKSIFFIQSAKKAYELHKKYKKYSMFNCSSNNKLFKHVDQNKLEYMLHNERFEDLILFTTTVMDAGVNIHDKELNNILCDVQDIRTLQQCIGRKRLQSHDDYIHLTVKNINNNIISGRMGNLQKDREMTDYLRLKDTKALIRNYPREYDKTRIIYDDIKNGNVVKKVNELAYFKCWTDQVDYQDMLALKKDGYAKYLALWFGFYDKKTDKFLYHFREDEDSKETLKEYLDIIVGKKLYKEEQKELKEIFKNNGLNARTLGINTLNGNLKDRKISYMIIAKRASKRVNGKVKSIRYWEVIDNIEL